MIVLVFVFVLAVALYTLELKLYVDEYKDPKRSSVWPEACTVAECKGLCIASDSGELTDVPMTVRFGGLIARMVLLMGVYNLALFEEYTLDTPAGIEPSRFFTVLVTLAILADVIAEGIERAIAAEKERLVAHGAREVVKTLAALDSTLLPFAPSVTADENKRVYDPFFALTQRGLVGGVVGMFVAGMLVSDFARTDALPLHSRSRLFSDMSVHLGMGLFTVISSAPVIVAINSAQCATRSFVYTFRGPVS